MKMDPEPLASRQPITRELERFLSKPAESSFCTVPDVRRDCAITLRKQPKGYEFGIHMDEIAVIRPSELNGLLGIGKHLATNR